MAIQRESTYSKKKENEFKLMRDSKRLISKRSRISFRSMRRVRKDLSVMTKESLKRARIFVHDFLLLLKRITGSSIFYTKCPT